MQESSTIQEPKRGTLGRWLKEPLLHFLIAGAILFAAYRVLNPQVGAAADPQHIELTKDDLRQLAITWLAQGHSLPTPDQLQRLAEEKVTEEILSREAIALGLDRDDEIIKRRLAQKMDFLAADLAKLQDPTTAELKTWFAAQPDRFALPPRASFRHLYFSPDKRGEGAREAAAAALSGIAGKAPDAPDVVALGDRFMFQDFYGDRTPEDVAKDFGLEFAKSLFQLKPGAWHGPIKSGYGWHLVWIDSLEPSRIPAFEEVDVKSEWVEDQYNQIKERALKEMRSRYTVVIPPTDQVDLKNLPARPALSSDLTAE